MTFGNFPFVTDLFFILYFFIPPRALTAHIRTVPVSTEPLTDFAERETAVTEVMTSIAMDEQQIVTIIQWQENDINCKILFNIHLSVFIIH